jgi:hypothetical protein
VRSVRERPSGCVTENPSSSTTILRIPNVLRAFEPRIEMPMSRGPFPCLNETQGLSCSRSWIVKAGSSLMRSPLRVVMVCPGGFGRAPGAGPDSAAGAAAGDAAAEGNDGDLNGRVTVETGWRGAATARGAGAVVTRLGRGAVTTTLGTGTEGGAGAAGALGSPGAGACVG